MATTNETEIAMQESRRFIPKDGANLVGNNDFEEHGNQLYLIGHFASVEEAQAAKAARELSAGYNGDELFIFEPFPPGFEF